MRAKNKRGKKSGSASASVTAGRGDILAMCERARSAARILARSSITSQTRNDALKFIAQGLIDRTPEIIAENEKDLAVARDKGLSSAMIDRLKLDAGRIKKIADGVRQIENLPDPVGEITRMWTRPNGLSVGRMRMPIGVVAIIYESRPNVTIDTAALTIKSGNAIILRGGSESIRSNTILARIASDAVEKAGLPRDAVQSVAVTDRSAVMELLKMDKHIDIVIPRGGEQLIRTVVENSTIPVIKHDKGVCHLYIDDSADIKMAVELAFNSKVQRPGVCNAMETLLVHESIAPKFLPKGLKKLADAGVELRGCAITRKIATGAGIKVKPATEADWHAEYLELILAVRVVKDIDQAMEHIATYGSAHTDNIVTTDHPRAMRFIREVDSASVMVNASTRFSDGMEFGLGAEMGISTQKLHCRGPMGLEELTTQKFIVFGSGQVRT